MKKSPKTTWPGRRRASPGWLAGILAEARTLPRRRLAFGLLAAFGVLWGALAVAVETSQALRFRLADPWPADQPALWTPDSGHVERLEAATRRLRACLQEHGFENEALAVAPDPSLGYQGLYWTLWVISMLPEIETRPLGADGKADPARLLVAGSPRDGKLVCTVDPLRLYSLGDPAP